MKKNSKKPPIVGVSKDTLKIKLIITDFGEGF